MNSKAKDLIKVMTAHNYVLVRAKRHAIWQHRLTGHRIVTGMTPSDRKALINITCRAVRGSRPTSPLHVALRPATVARFERKGAR